MARPEAFNADRNLYRSKDGARIVEEDDPEALTLAYAVGDMVDAETAKAHQLGPRPAKGEAAKSEAAKPAAAAEDAEVEPEHKRAAASEDKARKAPQEDK